MTLQIFLCKHPQSGRKVNNYAEIFLHVEILSNKLEVSLMLEVINKQIFYMNVYVIDAYFSLG